MEISKLLSALVLAILVKALPLERVHSGSPVDIEEFPFLASLSTAADGQYCGAVILTSYYVMTAAHCIKPEMLVRAGSSLRSSGGTVHQVTGACAPPQHRQRPTAPVVLALAQPIVFEHAAVAQAPLPPQGAPVAAGVFAFVAGWGSEQPSGAPSEQLLYGELTTTAPETCAAAHPDLDVSELLCAASDNVHTCAGDAGGPLVSSGMVTGLAVPGLCGEIDAPSLFTDVADYSTWIAWAASGVPDGESNSGTLYCSGEIEYINVDGRDSNSDSLGSRSIVNEDTLRTVPLIMTF